MNYKTEQTANAKKRIKELETLIAFWQKTKKTNENKITY